MYQIRTALELSYEDNNKYPTSDRDGCGGWDVGNQSLPLLSGNKLGVNIPHPPVDPIATGNCGGYRYYRYAAGSYNCPASKGAFYVLGVTKIWKQVMARIKIVQGGVVLEGIGKVKWNG